MAGRKRGGEKNELTPSEKLTIITWHTAEPGISSTAMADRVEKMFGKRLSAGRIRGYWSGRAPTATDRNTTRAQNGAAVDATQAAMARAQTVQRAEVAVVDASQKILMDTQEKRQYYVKVLESLDVKPMLEKMAKHKELNEEERDRLYRAINTVHSLITGLDATVKAQAAVGVVINIDRLPPKELTKLEAQVSDRIMDEIVSAIWPGLCDDCRERLKRMAGIVA